MNTTSLAATKAIRLLSAVMLFGLLLWPVRSPADQGGQRIEGSWNITVTAVNLPDDPTFTSLLTVIPGGTVVESRRLYVPLGPLGPMLETPGHGAWVKTGDHTYRIVFTFLLQGAPNHPDPALAGSSLGTDNISMHVQLDHSGDRFAGEFESEIRDPEGNVVFTFSGPVEAARISAEKEE